ncbi:MAG TPA: cytochrome c peroxidase [Kofleriaceae bacterium]|jgi:cytochrome c peroxidase
MKRGLIAALVVSLTGALVGCGDDSGGGDGGGDDGSDGFTAAEIALMNKHSPLPAIPAETTNKYADNADAATLGQKLFHDKAFSGPIVVGDDGTNGGLGAVGDTGKVACASCHAPPWLYDTRSMPNATTLGTNYMSRNATSVLNTVFYDYKETDGIRDSAWSDSLTDPEDPTSMHGSRSLVAHTLYRKYKDEYNALFTEYPLDPRLDPTDPNAGDFPDGAMPGTPEWDGMDPADQDILNRTYANFGKAMQAYLRKLTSENSAFDKYVAGDHSQLTDDQKAGLHLFLGKAGCENCHSGPIFSDNKFHDTAMVETGAHVNPAEQGHFDGIAAVIADTFNTDSTYSDDTTTGRVAALMALDADAERGKWRTKGLREVEMTAPYEHTGQIATTLGVIQFDNMGGDASGFTGTRDPQFTPLNLTAEEMGQIDAFLGSLTGDEPPASLTADTSNPD